MIPPQLERQGFRFVKVIGKQPVEKNWTETANYPHDSENLRAWIEKGNNYGVLCGRAGLIGIDYDTPEAEEKYRNKLPKTFSVITATKKLHHDYYLIDGEPISKSIRNGNICLDIRGEGTQLVGAGSIIKDKEGKIIGTYKVDQDLPIATITETELKKALELEVIELKPADTSRSGQEWGEIIRRIKKGMKSKEGLDRDEIFNAMNKYSKWKDSTQQYKEITWNKALEHITKEEKEKDKKIMEKIRENKPIIELLEQEEQNAQYLDLGETKETWYYGFMLKGRESIITSKGEILRNTEENFKDKIIGENEIKKLFDYKGYVGDIAPTIARETIKKIYTKSQKNYLIKPKEVYRSVRDKILYYMDFAEQEEIADVLTCWIIATYCYPLFYWFPHILINAPRESGKSKCGYIVMQLSFRGFDLGASAGVTPAQIFRTLEGNRGTIFLDEFEIANGKNASETQALVNQILNASTTRDAYVIRTEQIEKKWLSMKFPIFCPKIVCNISGINPTSLTRFIAFKWLKTISEKGKRKPYREKDKKGFEPVRENLYLLMLENWQKIKEIYADLDLSLNNRFEDNWLPLFAVARFIDVCDGEQVNAEEQLTKYVSNYNEVDIETGDNTAEFFNLLYELLSDEIKVYQPKEIGEWVDMKELIPSYIKSPATWIGKKLTLYKIKSIFSSGTKKYLLNKASIKNVINLYFTSYTKEVPPSTTTTTNPTNPNQPQPSEVGLGGGSGTIPEVGLNDFCEEKIG